MSLLYQDIIIHRHYNVRIRAIARARVCVCGKTASCASLQVSLRKTDLVKELLEFYMGKNTMERQNFIIDNLVVEEDIA